MTQKDITRAAAGESYPLTPAQRRLWVLHHAEGAAGAYNHVFAIGLAGTLDYKVFNQAVLALVQRHESLRTVFVPVDGEPRQYVLQEVHLEAALDDMTGSGDPEAEIRQLIRHEDRFVFDLGTFPLFRVRLIRTGAAQHVCIFNVHLIAGDAASRDVLLADFYRFYESGMAGVSAGAAPPAAGVKDYAAWHGRRAYRERLRLQEAYWLERLGGPLPVPTLPADRPRPEITAFEGDEVRFVLDGEQTESLRQMAAGNGATLYAVLLAACHVLLGKLGNPDDSLIATPAARREPGELAGMVGLLENTLLLRNAPAPDQGFRAFLAAVHQTVSAAFAHPDYPYGELLKKLSAPTETRPNPVCSVHFSLCEGADAGRDCGGLRITPYACPATTARFDLSVDVFPAGAGLDVRFLYPTARFDRETVVRFTGYYRNVLSAVLADLDVPVGAIEVLGAAEKNQLLHGFNLPARLAGSEATVVSLFGQQVARAPDTQAVSCKGEALTFRELDEKSNQLAYQLRETYGVKRGGVVAITGERSNALVVGLLGILKAGAAYVPVDPAATPAQTAYLLTDSKARALLVAGELPATFRCDREVIHLERVPGGSLAHLGDVVTGDDLCCLHYAPDGSATPKGVMLSHANLAGLFAGMSERLPVPGDACLLTLAGIADEACLLQLVWPLCAGIEVVLHPADAPLDHLDAYGPPEDFPMDFSLFFFANYNVAADDKYRLLLDAVQYADREGFRAVWVPERHFHDFGGLFPTPSVVSAALAMITKNIQLRSGSIVSPLHDPIRIAEEWSVVDNLSRGRVALSFAPGWNSNDFALAPGHFAERHRIMHEQIETVKRLWRGESIKRANGLGKEIDVLVFPAPIQRDLSVWLTAAGNEKTFIVAGETGADLLTHLLGQDLKDLARKIGLYREARRRAGHDQKTGRVAVMLHTYVGDEIDQVEKVVEQPFIEYLKSAVGLSKILYEEAGLKEVDIPEADKEIMLRHSFKRYYQTAALIGTGASCRAMVRKLREIGVDEIACLVDFGVAPNQVMHGLKNLKALKDLFAGPGQRRHKPVNVLQATPSLVAQLRQQPGSGRFLSSLGCLLVSGDVPAAAPEGEGGTRTVTLFGRPEATLVTAVRGAGEPALGKCLPGVQVYVLNRSLGLVPVGVEGELYIGGTGVAGGYWQKPEATAERFFPHPVAENEKIYKTGLMARWRPDGTVELTGTNRQDPHPPGGQLPAYASPATETEEKLAALWVAVPGVTADAGGVNSSFFETGGDSLRAVALLQEVRRAFGVPLGLGQLYHNPSVRQLAAVLEKMGVRNLALVPRAALRAYYPASYFQEQLYRDQVENPDATTGHVFGAYRITGPYDAGRLAAALRALPGRHDALRTGFAVREGEVVQQIAGEAVLEVAVHEGSAYRTVQEAAGALVRPFDLAGPCLVRCAIVRHGPDGDWLLLHAHGLVCDQASLDILVREAAARYAGVEPEPVRLSYVDYACWQRDRRDELAKESAYWTETLSGALPELDLPVTQHRDAVDEYRMGRQGVTLDEETYGALGRLKGTSDTAAAVILLSVYYILLAKISEQSDLVIEVQVPGRDRAALRNAVGPFANPLPLRVCLPGGIGYGEFLANVQDRLRQAADHGEYPYARMLAALPSGAKRVANVYFTHFPGTPPVAYPTAPGLVAGEAEWPDPTSRYEFGMEVSKQDNQLRVWLVYCRELYEADTIALFAEYFSNILRTVLTDQAVCLEDIELENALGTA